MNVKGTQGGSRGMTIKEAICYLSPIAESASLARYKEALQMAIAALRAQQEEKNEPPTNADRIRAMNDKELAKVYVREVHKTDDEYCWPVYITSDGKEFDNYKGALKHETEWLKQPAEEGER